MNKCHMFFRRGTLIIMATSTASASYINVNVVNVMITGPAGDTINHRLIVPSNKGKLPHYKYD